MRTRRRRIALVLGAIGLLFALVLLLLRPSGPDPLKVSTQARAIMQALVVYAQNHGDAYPPPEDMSRALAAAGIVPADLFSVRGAPAGVPPFLAVLPPEGSPSRWSNSFDSARPLILVNPALWPGRPRTSVGYGDNHIEWVEGEDLRRLMDGLAGQLRPVR